MKSSLFVVLPHWIRGQNKCQLKWNIWYHQWSSSLFVVEADQTGTITSTETMIFEDRTWICKSQTVSNWCAKFDDEIMREFNVLMILTLSKKHGDRSWRNTSVIHRLEIELLLVISRFTNSNVTDDEWSSSYSYLEEVFNWYCDFCKSWFRVWSTLNKD